MASGLTVEDALELLPWLERGVPPALVPGGIEERLADRLLRAVVNRNLEQVLEYAPRVTEAVWHALRARFAADPALSHLTLGSYSAVDCRSRLVLLLQEVSRGRS